MDRITQQLVQTVMSICENHYEFLDEDAKGRVELQKEIETQLTELGKKLGLPDNAIPPYFERNGIRYPIHSNPNMKPGFGGSWHPSGLSNLAPEPGLASKPGDMRTISLAPDVHAQGIRNNETLTHEIEHGLLDTERLYPATQRVMERHKKITQDLEAEWRGLNDRIETEPGAPSPQLLQARKDAAEKLEVARRKAFLNIDSIQQNPYKGPYYERQGEANSRVAMVPAAAGKEMEATLQARLDKIQQLKAEALKSVPKEWQDFYAKQAGASEWNPQVQTPANAPSDWEALVRRQFDEIGKRLAKGDYQTGKSEVGQTSELAKISLEPTPLDISVAQRKRRFQKFMKDIGRFAETSRATGDEFVSSGKAEAARQAELNAAKGHPVVHGPLELPVPPASPRPAPELVIPDTIGRPVPPAVRTAPRWNPTIPDRVAVPASVGLGTAAGMVLQQYADDILDPLMPPTDYVTPEGKPLSGEEAKAAKAANAAKQKTNTTPQPVQESFKDMMWNQIRRAYLK